MRHIYKLTLALSLASTVYAASAERSWGVSHSAVHASERTAFFGSRDRIFPQIASGGGWETVIVVVNMSTVRLDFRMRFYDQAGVPMSVTSRDYPGGEIKTGSVIDGFFGPRGSFNFALFDVGQLKVGWMVLDYNSNLGRIGAYALLRQLVPGRSPYEALVPLSSEIDPTFFMPFDNIQGFTTSMALVNGGAVATALSLHFMDLRGNTILRDSITLAAGQHIAFGTTALYPQLRDRLGTVHVQGASLFLSAMGLRFNSAGPFSSVPIMNWSGILP